MSNLYWVGYNLTKQIIIRDITQYGRRQLIPYRLIVNGFTLF